MGRRPVTNEAGPCRRPRAFVCLVLAGLLLGLSRPALPDISDDAVREAAQVTYIHGMTAEIANEEFGPDALATLHELLADPDFPRRDNVVAVLGFLGNDASVGALLTLLRQPPAPVEVPDEDRALLLAPQALGQIASRGHQRALEALLAMTEHGGNGGVLGATAARSSRPQALRDDLVEMALRGLGWSDAPAARARIDEVARGSVRPGLSGRDPAPAADRARDLQDWLERGGPRGSPSAQPHPLDGPPGASAAPAGQGRGRGGNGSGTVAQAFDGSHSQVNRSLLDYANHVNVTDPMTDARLDEILQNASLNMGRGDFSGDVACCAGLRRDGTGQSFGSAGDGLDIIDSGAEVTTVLNHPSARNKIVRTINWCSGPGSNIIGCGWVGAKGTAIVRFATGDAQREGALWAHEYGHNTNLGHNTISSTYIMWGSIVSNNNRGLTQAECDAYHSPPSGTQAELENIGACTDVDVDEVHDVIDNCPTIANNNQLDSNGDGIGDACTGPICGNGVIDPGEDCDIADLGGQTCQNLGLGFDAGTLFCTGSCTFDTSQCSTCGNGVIEGTEACDGSNFGGDTCGTYACAAGSLVCDGSCSLQDPYQTCSQCDCDFDSVCELPEDCSKCPSDCVAGTASDCGNGICEIADGEDCQSCEEDCNGKQNGGPGGRFCCGDGAGQNPVDCTDARCTESGWDCTDVPGVASCCGDLTCAGIENPANCAVDCSCGDAFCDSPFESSCNCALDCGTPPGAETGFCNDGDDNDCDGAIDCEDLDCATDLACLPACDNGIDDDGDTVIDAADPGCDTALDDSERSPLLVCDDGVDNDLDGGIDYDPDPGEGDPACIHPAWGAETAQCQDGIDNDLDGRVDFDGGESIHGACSGGVCPPGVSDPDADGVADPDPQCSVAWVDREVPPSCGLGFELGLLLPLLWLRRGRSATPGSPRLD